MEQVSESGGLTSSISMYFNACFNVLNVHSGQSSVRLNKRNISCPEVEVGPKNIFCTQPDLAKTWEQYDFRTLQPDDYFCYIPANTFNFRDLSSFQGIYSKLFKEWYYHCHFLSKFLWPNRDLSPGVLSPGWSFYPPHDISSSKKIYKWKKMWVIYDIYQMLTESDIEFNAKNAHKRFLEFYHHLCIRSTYFGGMIMYAYDDMRKNDSLILLQYCWTTNN